MAYAQHAGPARYRLFEDSPVMSPVVSASGLNALSTPGEMGATSCKPWHPDSPMFAFGVLGALAFGLMAFSTSGTVRVGKTKLTGALGVGS
jgi:hypothetical protein